MTALPPADPLDTLRQRHDYLTGRVELKKSLGWEWTYDARERDALAWAIQRLTRDD